MQILKSCAYCSSWNLQTTSFCKECFQVFERQSLKSFYLPGEAELLARSLFLWREDNHDFIHFCLHHLKGKNFAADWRKIAEIFLLNYAREETLDGPCFLVPAPSERGEDSHAHLFAKAFAEILGWTYFSPLSKVKDTCEQKSKGREERQRLQISSQESLTSARVWLIDDVITTGSTARSCYQALGKPTSFQVCALAYRELIYKS